MPRAFWRGSISFGLVNIPVALHPAQESHDLSFNQLDRRDLNPIGYKRINKKTEKEVPWSQIVRGYQYRKGRYVVLTDQDLRRANVEATQTIDIVGFVEASQISPLYFETPYYIEPSKGGAKAYALLRDALKRTGRVGVASVVLRTRQHMAALIEREGVLVLELLRWNHEIRDPKDLEIPGERGARVSAKEADMAEQLVRGMSDRWNPKQYKDTYAADLMALIRKKVSSGKTAEIDESEPPARKEGVVVDLMPLLKQSLEGARGGMPAAHRRTSSARGPAAQAASAGGRRRQTR